MPQVKVWNDHDREHVERFKGEMVRIPAGGFIMMDYIDAEDFKGQYFGMRMLGPNNPDPATFKKIRVEKPDQPVIKPDPNMFHATGQVMGSPAEVIAMANALKALKPELAVEDKELDNSAAALRSENEALKAELAALQAKRKPGRPAKAANA